MIFRFDMVDLYVFGAIGVAYYGDSWLNLFIAALYFPLYMVVAQMIHREFK